MPQPPLLTLDRGSSCADPPEVCAGSGVRVIVGRYSSIATGVRFVGAEGDERGSGADLGSAGEIRIGNGARVGPFALILSGVTVGDGAAVAAGAVVTESVPPFAVVAGNPARVVRSRFDARTVARLQALRWWEWPEERATSAAELVRAGRAAELLGPDESREPESAPGAAPGSSDLHAAQVPEAVPPSAARTRFVDLARDAFSARFGNPDTRSALCGFTPPADTHAVLALVAHVRPRRVLEIGTAAGHMTANLTAFTPPDAKVFSLGIVAEDRPQSGATGQQYEVPVRDQFAKFVNHFGTAHKALLITADSRTYDFGRLGTLDFVFVDGGHDLATARSDSEKAYRALRPGGALVWHDVPSPVQWVAVEEAIAGLGFAEVVYKVAGTQVAFLIKGEDVRRAIPAGASTLSLVWDGPVGVSSSLAHVNRSVCLELVTRGHRVALAPQPPGGMPAAPHPIPAALRGLVGPGEPGAVHVRHRWPADFTKPPGGGPLVLMQPWEYGRLPRAWIEPLLTAVDEVWAYSRYVRDVYVASGIPAERVALVPPGVDTDRFRPGLEPLPLPTEKRVKLLFVGGTIPRKGFDALLTAYRRAFTRSDDVCLVVKEVGAGTYYRNQTADALIRAAQADGSGPEVVYLTADLREDELPRLFAACDALVHPYRGEGFGLPVLEAMACGLPVVVTAGGPTDEFVPPSAGWQVPARVRHFDREAVGEWPTVGRPWLLEPELEVLTALLHAVASNQGDRVSRGMQGRQAALGWSWARTASVIEDRVRATQKAIPRFERNREV